MERKVGELFEFKGKIYKVIESENTLCPACAFKGMCIDSQEISGPCVGRTDKKFVIFKEVNMKIKDNKLTINIPRGMKIDVENSDLEKGIIKFKKKDLTYKDIEVSLNLSGCKEFNINNAPKLYAINQLMNIASYYNKGWKPNWNNEREDKYYICYINRINDYVINCANATNNSFVYFKNEQDINTIICNPEFKDILDAIYKN